MTIHERLTGAIRSAMRERDAEALSIYRITLSEISNAEAIPADVVRAGALEAAPLGVGATEAERRTLTEADVAGIVRSEILELTMGSKHVGPDDHRRMLRQASLLESLLRG